MANPCQTLEQKLSALQHAKRAVSQAAAADLADAGPSQKPAILAEEKKELNEINAQIAELRAQLDACQSKRDVILNGPAEKGLDAFDLAIQEFMRANHVRAGQLTILKDGLLALSHAYAYDFGSDHVTPGSLFRIASCSKAFTCAAVWQLYNEGKLHPSDTIYSLLGITSQLVGAVDPRSNTITIDELVKHAGGWNDHVASQNPPIAASAFGDPVFKIRTIANDLKAANKIPAHTLPSKMQIAGYMYGQPLQFAPGSFDFTTSKGLSYSNYGYVLLGLAVEHATGKSYIDYVRSSVLKPLGLEKHIFVSPMLSATVNPLEVHYDDPGMGLTALDPDSNAIVPYAYGGEGYVTELMDSGGGLMTTATTLALFVHNRAAWGMGGRMVGSARSGGMAGVSSYMESRVADIDYAFIFNTRRFSQPGDPISDLVKKLESLFAAVPIKTPELHLGPIPP